MKRTIAFLCALGLVASSAPNLAFAQTATSTDTQLAQIQELTKQIKALQEQILKLQGQQVTLQADVQTSVTDLLKNLKEGSEGEQVKVLQTLLALDASIYPEGKITGFFGPLTSRALRKFQQKNALEGVGFVGPRTHKLLEKMFKEQFKQAEKLSDDIADDIEDEIKAAFGGSFTFGSYASSTGTCVIPGVPYATTTPFFNKEKGEHIIAMGNVFIYKKGGHRVVITPNSYIEKDGKRQTIITPGMHFEKDGKKRSLVNCNATSTSPVVDTGAPVISNIVANATLDQITVTWTTNELASGKLYFATSSPVATATAYTKSHSGYDYQHSITLTGLFASTTHYFLIESKDVHGNTAISSERSLMTSVPVDATAPTISGFTITPATTTAHVVWNTNEAAQSSMYYATTTPVDSATSWLKSDNSLVTAHSLELTGLTASTTYYAFVVSKDASNNTATSTQTTFTTTQ